MRVVVRICVLISSVAALALAGCSLGTRNVSYGLNSNTVPQGLTQRPDGSIGASSQRGQKARRKDAAPKGSYTKAPRGALADRNYRETALNIANAKKLINKYRRDNGLKPLKLDAQLTKAAKAHSRDLAKWDRISHFGSDGSNPWDRVKRVGYKARMAAENVGTGQTTLQEVMAGWKKSPGHNKNLLLPDAEHMGIALVHDPKTEFRTFWTLVLGARI